MFEPNRTIASAIKTARESTRDLRMLRASLITLCATLLTSVPVAAQVGSAEEARNLEGITVLEAFVYLFQAVAPLVAVIVILASFIALMSTRDPQVKTAWKERRNSAVAYGLILAPALGTVLAIIGGVTGNPVLEGLNI